MAIAIQTSAAIDIENYDGLIAFVIAHLELDAETAAQVPTFIRMAEYRLNRMLTRPERETSASLTTTAGIKFVALPVDYTEIRQAYLNGEYPLTTAEIGSIFGQYDVSGIPKAYAVSEQSLYLGPTPDAEYTIIIKYLAKLAQLSEANQTNWLLVDHADSYIYATLIQAESFLGHDSRIPLLNEALEITMAEINAQGNRYRSGGGTKLRSPVCV